MDILERNSGLSIEYRDVSLIINKLKMETVKTKKCAKCHQELPVTEFWKDGRAKDGLNCYCKGCMKTFTSKARTRMKINKPDKTRI